MPDLRCDLLKVPHQGSKGSSSDAFVTRTNPNIAVMTVGRKNPYHPCEESLSRYENTGSGLYRTDRDGAVTVRIRDDRLDVTRWNDLALKSIDIRDSTVWRENEKMNWNRLVIRSGVF